MYSLITRGHVSSGYLGVILLTVTPTVKARYGLSVDSGAVITEVVAGGPADTAGLMVDDVITGFDGAAITSSHVLLEALRSHSAGGTVTVTYVRGQAARSTSVTLGQQPSA